MLILGNIRTENLRILEKKLGKYVIIFYITFLSLGLSNIEVVDEINYNVLEELYGSGVVDELENILKTEAHVSSSVEGLIRLYDNEQRFKTLVEVQRAKINNCLITATINKACARNSLAFDDLSFLINSKMYIS